MVQGKFTQEYLGSDALHALSSNDDAVSPVLMEVLQASSRMSVPDAAKRRVWELCDSRLRCKQGLACASDTAQR